MYLPNLLSRSLHHHASTVIPSAQRLSNHHQHLFEPNPMITSASSGNEIKTSRSWPSRDPKFHQEQWGHTFLTKVPNTWFLTLKLSHHLCWSRHQYCWSWQMIYNYTYIYVQNYYIIIPTWVRHHKCTILPSSSDHMFINIIITWIQFSSSHNHKTWCMSSSGWVSICTYYTDSFNLALITRLKTWILVRPWRWRSVNLNYLCKLAAWCNLGGRGSCGKLMGEGDTAAACSSCIATTWWGDLPFGGFGG
jgi:hypothetical protein